MNLLVIVPNVRTYKKMKKKRKDIYEIPLNPENNELGSSFFFFFFFYENNMYTYNYKIVHTYTYIHIS